jgi:hypothetical protein
MIKGFTYCGYCNCTGTRNNKYEKDGYIIYYQPKRKLYHLKYNNSYIIKNEPITTLCQKLKSLGLIDSGECLETN